MTQFGKSKVVRIIITSQSHTRKFSRILGTRKCFSYCSL